MPDGTPPGAPYSDVVLDEPVEISVYPREDGLLIAEFDFRGDKFGSSADLEGLEGLDLTLAVDALVGQVASLAYHELGAHPIFREEDEEFVGRVDNSRPWEATRRLMGMGWVANYAGNPGVELAEPERDPIAASIGDADVSSLRLTQEDMAALSRGEVPDSMIERLLKARSTENLLDSVAETLASVELRTGSIERAERELAEVRSRFG